MEAGRVNLFFLENLNGEESVRQVRLYRGGSELGNDLRR